MHYDILSEAHRAGLITWESIVTKQRQEYPRCAAHDTPTAYVIDGIGALCPLCVTEQWDAIRAALAAKRQ